MKHEKEKIERPGLLAQGVLPLFSAHMVPVPFTGPLFRYGLFQPALDAAIKQLTCHYS